jgi:HEPN domain-containing protein
MTNQTNRGDAKILLNGAKEFLEAAQILSDAKQENETKFGQYFAPTTYLALHALELALKAFLMTNGTSLNGVRKIGHDIAKLAMEVKTLGNTDVSIKLDEQDGGIIVLSEIYKNKVFEYPREGSHQAPDETKLIHFVEEVIQLTEPHVVAYFHGSKKFKPQL